MLWKEAEGEESKKKDLGRKKKQCELAKAAFRSSLALLYTRKVIATMATVSNASI